MYELILSLRHDGGVCAPLSRIVLLSLFYPFFCLYTGSTSKYSRTLFMRESSSNICS